MTRTVRRKRRFHELTRAHILQLFSGCCLLRRRDGGQWGFGEGPGARGEMERAWLDPSVRAAVREYWLEKWGPGGKRGEKRSWAEREFGAID